MKPPILVNVKVMPKLLENPLFPDFKNDSSLEDLREVNDRDALAIHVWRLYTRGGKQLPNAERMQNLVWRMMALTLGEARFRGQYWYPEGKKGLLEKVWNIYHNSKPDLPNAERAENRKCRMANMNLKWMACRRFRRLNGP